MEVGVAPVPPPQPDYHQKLKTQWEHDEVKRARFHQQRRQALDVHMKELIVLREQGAADKIVLLREKIKGEMEDINRKAQLEIKFRKAERSKRRRDKIEESRAEAKASVEKVREEARKEATEEKQAALAELHHKVQKELKEANSPANRLAREEKMKALEAKKEQMEKQRQERLKQKRELEKLQQTKPISNSGLK